MDNRLTFQMLRLSIYLTTVYVLHGYVYRALIALGNTLETVLGGMR